MTLIRDEPAILCEELLYYVVTRLPDSLRVVRDHFLSVCPTTLTVDLLKERLLAAEQSIVAVGASRGDPRTPIFEGCSPCCAKALQWHSHRTPIQPTSLLSFWNFVGWCFNM
ncbi:unnamed protein product, partial [Closterium sp. NIES-53]